MKKKKNRRKPGMLNKKKHTISYVCADCGVKEEIPVEALKFFDNFIPEQLLFGDHQFSCEKCDTGTMKQEKKPTRVLNYLGDYEVYFD